MNRFSLRSLSCLTLGLVLLFSFSACNNSQAGAGTAEAAPPAAAVNSDLAITSLMTQLGHFSNRLGWSVHAQNQPLSSFYLDKMDQVLGELNKIDRWEGIPIGSMAQATMGSSLKALRGSTDTGDWASAAETYRGMTLACNSCHAATRRAFIVIQPVTSTPPEGQLFAAP